MIDQREVHRVMSARGFSLYSTGGTTTFVYVTDDIQPSIACNINILEETFQLQHVTKKGLTLQTGVCGSLFADDHFNRHLRNMVHYIANGD